MRVKAQNAGPDCARAVLMYGHVAQMLLPVAVALTCNKVMEGRVKFDLAMCRSPTLTSSSSSALDVPGGS